MIGLESRFGYIIVPAQKAAKATVQTNNNTNQAFTNVHTCIEISKFCNLHCVVVAVYVVVIAEPEGEATNLDTQITKRKYICINV